VAIVDPVIVNEGDDHYCFDESSVEYYVDDASHRWPLWLFTNGPRPSGWIVSPNFGATSDPVIVLESRDQHYVDGTGHRQLILPVPPASAGLNSNTGWARNVDRPTSWSTPQDSLEQVRPQADPAVRVTPSFGLSDPPSAYSPFPDGHCPGTILSALGEVVILGRGAAHHASLVEYYKDDVLVTWHVSEGNASTVLSPPAPNDQMALGDASPVTNEDHE
jgi:hypothetical protein